MLRGRPTLHFELGATLGTLPDQFIVSELSGAQFVAGPSGVYVIAAVDQSRVRVPDLRSVPDLGRLAAQVRASLADHLTLVPFVQALRVSAEGGAGAGRSESEHTEENGSPIVPIDLLVDVLVEGRPILSPATVHRLDELAVSGRLGPTTPMPTAVHAHREPAGPPVA